MTLALINNVRVVDDLDSLFRAHFGRLVRALTVACGDEQMAADAVQHAFVKAHLKWRNIMNYEDPVGWIRRVAINKLRDEHRSNRRKRGALDRLAAEPEEHAAEPDASADTGPGDLVGLLAGLPRQQRISLALFYVDGLSVAEVASALGINDGTVKFHLHQGRAALRARIARGEP